MEYEEMKNLKGILELRFQSCKNGGYFRRRNKCDEIIPGLFVGDW